MTHGTPCLMDQKHEGDDKLPVCKQQRRWHTTIGSKTLVLRANSNSGALASMYTRVCLWSNQLKAAFAVYSPTTPPDVHRNKAPTAQRRGFQSRLLSSVRPVDMFSKCVGSFALMLFAAASVSAIGNAANRRFDWTVPTFEMMFDLPAGKIDCFYEHVEIGGRFKFTFRVSQLMLLYVSLAHMIYLSDRLNFIMNYCFRFSCLKVRRKCCQKALVKAEVWQT